MVLIVHRNSLSLTHTHTHTLSLSRARASDEGIGTAVKNSLEIEQVHLEGGFKRGGRIKVAERLRQTVL